MDYLNAIILSIVEGATEFLPISSTGHLVLASKVLNIPQTNFIKSFEIFIQLGAILAVVFLYWQKLIYNFKLWKNILIAFIPTAIVGLAFYEIIKNYFIGNLQITLLALFLGGLILIFVDKLLKEKDFDSLEKLTVKQSLLIGLAQSVSVIPGVSRAAATIIGGQFAGLSKKAALEFSFLLAIPTMFAATGLDVIKSNFNFSLTEWSYLFIGFIGSFITALFVIKWFIKFVEKNNFFIFGVYRIILSILFWFTFLR
ncbi:MAG: hypothetical protein ACD_30C00049G0025 [uncultured bacterium]|uniref:Undecaprenyl-diphosphatase n=4 Tax=Candidatus Daviesiibacteriota TaxID=1752718 RepID=A0A0G0HF07_9BACT|nr:MAG: hypothetical protein ACD_30C00049G0025 [uncultured bacterium]KKQ10679.1 MAG: Undecaprenyl-diphosphatase [Candidatus Daviesbacteria bacterium GW2011_GWB1_36_5]KKQ15001.1 MAG: Undecaprenyl-diphosphatase [Candidatus Daviesbacteria bacterium GW2011_GWA1_36_8]OGE16845.1 MAG: undecaprenyl-diphosphatase UppP [Candidatus Daviesbacteria bacterium RIFCSPHIGHO2_01_FULL_36_37]OGE31203.1 MAG: undecaprenyl-diphosphatase UppP [Candidatus Daviesbacteria bacterium RIFCSPHIGHO2_02_FULL_37_9]OGE35833.1 M